MTDRESEDALRGNLAISLLWFKDELIVVIEL